MRLRRALLAGLVAALLLADLAASAPSAAAQVAPANEVVDLVWVVNAINRRNCRGQAARDSLDDLNACFAALRAIPRQQSRAGEPKGLDFRRRCPQKGHLADDLRLDATLATEPRAF